MKLLLVLLIFLAGPAQAQSVSVRSGEHGTFTRLVFIFPTPVDWTLGRTPAGYGLQITGPTLSYDVSSIYQKISKDRLRSVWADPESGALLLGIDCECHAIPFELTPKILVVDIRAGRPPEGSSFELALADGTKAPPIQAAQRPRPRKATKSDQTYDWLAQAGPAQAQAAADLTAAKTGMENDLRLEDFRSMLIDEVGRGATQGVVEMERPSPTIASSADTLPENARVALNELPGIEISTKEGARPDLMVRGEVCPKAADLTAGPWAATDNPGSELAQARSALLTEFDVPEPKMVLHAVDTHLYFGFGAEARLLLTRFLPAGQADPLRIGLSYLVDSERPPENPFDAMQSCDTAVALWALLAAPDDKTLFHVNGVAASRTFLSLPPHLRSLFGSEVAKRLQRSGDSANAEVVRQSFERAVPVGDPTVSLLTADQALYSGSPIAAEAALPTTASGETAMAALLTLVEARFQQRKPLEGNDILTLEAFAFENGSGTFKPQLDRALSHGAALAGDFKNAFSRAEGTAVLEQDVWMLLGEMGAESQLLTFAVGLDPLRRATLPLATRTMIAKRLLDTGLPNAASDWAQSDDIGADLAARIALANGDARSALRALATQLPDADPDLVAASYAALGDYDSAASTYQAAGDREGAIRAQRWARNWPTPSNSAAEADENSPAEPWGTVANLIGTDETQASAPPLQASLAQLGQSKATREAIAALLQTAPMVSAMTPP
ncbi:MAG: hypothetical protein U0934_21390 [Pseudotabrizicola sp.]|uniref:hypothetical protein n=1 Tax=Pseudotabrizicola sp. TaxID=2939647 RepID=UPI00272F5A16|nr:hypothetical protein [Pseudotabrizicola sp.]MDP2082082.1 hypothetical protein [Pseudotabrizicola sp.]MDZ7576475.1 hypothetical protein [Pseudotabrizicola sp.]